MNTYSALSAGADIVLGEFQAPGLLTAWEKTQRLFGTRTRVRREPEAPRGRRHVVYTNENPYDTVPVAITSDRDEAEALVSMFQGAGIQSHFLTW